MQDEPGFIVIGKLVGVYGIKGWFKILSFTRPRENIFTYSPWLIKQNGDWQGMQLSEGKPQGKGLIASIAEITDRDEAMALVGSEIAINRDQLAEPKAAIEKNRATADMRGTLAQNPPMSRISLVWIRCCRAPANMNSAAALRPWASIVITAPCNAISFQA